MERGLDTTTCTKITILNKALQTHNINKSHYNDCTLITATSGAKIVTTTHRN